MAAWLPRLSRRVPPAWLARKSHWVQVWRDAKLTSAKTWTQPRNDWLEAKAGVGATAIRIQPSACGLFVRKRFLQLRVPHTIDRCPDI